MQPSNDKKRNRERNALGRLRTRRGVDFSWSSSSPIETNEHLGRCYFDGFTLGKDKFVVGDMIRMETKYSPEAIYRIVSVFQATKSFSGIWHKGNWQEIQKRGHPYMELQSRDTAELELLPDWLLDQSLAIKKVTLDSSKCVESVTPAIDWDSSFQAYEVCFYKSSKIHAEQNHPGVASLHHNDSSDDSDEEVGPFEQLVIHHQGPLFTSRVAAECTSHQKYYAFAEYYMEQAGVTPDRIQDVLKPSRKIEVFVVDDDTNKKLQVNELLENVKSQFYNFGFRSSQYQVCMELLKGRHPRIEGKMRSDVFFSAPCGFGKSLCFVVSAYTLGRITLVVEPLRALISSQIEQLRGRGVNVEQLLSHSDAKLSHELPALDYLQTLVNQYTQHKEDPQPSSRLPLIIFSTPEIIKSPSCLAAIKCLAAKNLLSLVVFDEFDYVDGCHENFRSSYVNLVSSMKETLQDSSWIPFLFLSATGSSDLIFEQLDTTLQEFSLSTIQRQKMSPPPVLFQTSFVLPRNHIYRVERKISLGQAVRRMSSILKEFQGESSCDGTSFPKCICYCLSPGKCKKAVNEFAIQGISATEFSSSTENDIALQRFQSGDVQVLCATSALGRGVQIDCPVRYIFHLVLPTSLAEYIQATGRGGRDGKACHCVLFYSPNDIGFVESVLQFQKIEIHQRKRLEVSLENVCKYAVEGKECRKYLLAHETNSFMRNRGPLLASSQLRKYSFCTKPHMCDNCCFEKRESNFKKIDISSVVGDLLFEVLSKKDAFDIGRVEKAATMMKTNALPQARAVLDLLLARCKGEKSKHSLLSDLVKYFERNHEGFIDVIPKGHLEFFIQYAKLEGKKAWYDFDRIPVPSKPATVKPRLSFNCTTQTIWPFLILYESNRLGLRVETMFPNGLIGPLSVACHTVYEKAEQKPASYIEKLGKMEKRTGNIHSPVSVSYRAELQGNGKLKLLEPENAVDRRIYRMYGSERFLEISFPSSISNESILSYILAPFHVCGRIFRFFWLKREDGIRAVLFAEEGSCLDYIPVSHVREQCIPKSSNPELTLGKWVKRMKQNFSDTTVGCTLPPGCVTILDDFNEPGVAEIDGAGLVSEEALSAIWNGYNTNRAEKSENLGNNKYKGGNSQNLPCPYSGFQGRLAGFKGIWILDSSLKGFVLQCRKSQLKYNIPIKCIDQSINETNDSHEQIEVVSFCRRQEAKLNVRAIQILEHYALIASQSDNLEKFLMQCFENTISEFKILAQGILDTLKSKLPIKNIDFAADNSYDEKFLSQMYFANVDLSDPEFHRCCMRWIVKQVTSIRDKAHYTIPDSVDLRLYPDHTRLLAQHEVYLCIEGKCCPAQEIIAMRSPSYFAGDMRRLRTVDKETLRKRAIEQSIDFSFFEKIQSALVTSILGNAAEASRMSGGDYDGDRAWICWNEELLLCLPRSEYFIPENTSDFSTVPSELELKSWSKCSNEDIVRYMINFRNHRIRLGEFSEYLDCFIEIYGFNDERTFELGKAAFLQVDFPFHDYKMKINIKPPYLWPDWKNRKNSYESKKMLGKLFRKANLEIRNLQCITYMGTFPKVVQNLITECSTKIDSEEMINIQSTAEKFISSYLVERGAKFNATREDEYFYKWQYNYCKDKRKYFIMNKGHDPNRFSPLYAAIFYKQCFKMEKENPFCKACEFVWNLCQEELIQIFSGNGSLTVSAEKSSNIR